MEAGEEAVRVIDSFEGEYRFLSNFFPIDPIPGGDTLYYPTVEHAYQAQKTTDLAVKRHIAGNKNPGYAKRAGQNVDLRPDWEEIKLDVMLRLLREKFKQPDLRKKLLATGDAHLVEGNHWKDTFWGVYKGIGENHLGRLLMQVREEIRAAGDA